MDEQIKKIVHEEVTKQMDPLTKSVAEVKQQNREQSGLLTMQVQRIETVDRWTKKLWSNGSGGPPGYLEIARKEDKDRLERQERMADERFEKVFESIEQLKADRLREEGKNALIRQLAVEKAEAEKIADSKKTHYWTRTHYAISIAAVLAGSWFWSLIHPLAKLLVDHLVKALQ